MTYDTWSCKAIADVDWRSRCVAGSCRQRWWATVHVIYRAMGRRKQVRVAELLLGSSVATSCAAVVGLVAAKTRGKSIAYREARCVRSWR